MPQATRVVAIGDMTFVCINKMDIKLRTLVGGKAPNAGRWSGVVDTLQQCRANAQLKWMKMKSRADDPMYETSAETTEITQAEIRSALVDIPQQWQDRQCPGICTECGRQKCFKHLLHTFGHICWTC